MATGTPPATTEIPNSTAPADYGAQAASQSSITQTMDLQQQVARLQALLEVSRQVHSTTREEEVLETVLRIVVRELEMAGASFYGSDLSYGDAPQKREDGNLTASRLSPE
jgi:hypothetical protein